MSQRSPSLFARPGHLCVGAAIVLGAIAAPRSATGKTLIDYFQPTPIACPLTKNTWGASSSVPRDTCNGLEDTKNPPQWLYWDGKILRAKDGKYHLLASRWAASAGHNGGWVGSDAILAVSDSSPLGPFVDKGVAYTNGPDSGDRSKGHNVSGAELPDGTYCLIVSEIVPFTIFTSPSLDGPWTNRGHAVIDGSTVANAGDPGGIGGSQKWESNVSLVVRPDGDFEIVQRHGIIALSKTGLLGPYKVQQPTYTYSANLIPPNNLASIYPNRQKHSSTAPGAPSSVESTYSLAEDPLIWYSGGIYHVVYDYPDDRIGYHLTSPDGIHDWADRGLAYDPRLAKQLFSNTDGTVVSWYKMERPNIITDNGHITHFTFAVTDVDKGQISGGSSHGNKVIAMAFDGVAFDNDYGVGGVDGGAGGSGGQGGGGDAGAAGGAGGSDAGSAGAGGSADAGGRGGAGGGSGGSGGSSGTSGNGGAAAGGASGTGSGGAGGLAGSGGSTATGGTTSGTGGTASGAGGRGGSSGPHGGSSSTTGPTGGSSGCGCALGDKTGGRGGRGLGEIGAMIVLVAIALRVRARERKQP